MTDNGDWLKKYHEEHASYGGASHEFHARAQTWVATRDAEIARLKAEVRADNAAAIEAAVLAQDEIARLKAEVERLTGELTDADQVTQDALGHARAAWEGERKRLEADLAAHKRALAAGPAALRALRSDDYSPGYVAGVVEDAQEAAMKEGT